MVTWTEHVISENWCVFLLEWALSRAKDRNGYPAHSWDTCNWPVNLHSHRRRWEMEGQRQPVSRRLPLDYMWSPWKTTSGIIFPQLTFISDFLPLRERLGKVSCHCTCPPDLFLSTGSRTIGSDLRQFTNQSGLSPTRCTAEELTFNWGDPERKAVSAENFCPEKLAFNDQFPFMSIH